jgi:DNA-binding LacI/PurR family transcriptional regulator
MPTLIDVAAAAGVSRSTVSNVFVHPELVRTEVRERVEAVARAIGYDGPDAKGRLLREGRFNALGVVMADANGIAEIIRSPYGRELLSGIAEACAEAGVNLSIVSGADDGIRSALVDGLIIDRATDVPRARLRRKPFVVIDDDGGPDVGSVRVEGYGGARLSAEHIAALGHRQVVIVAVSAEPGPLVFHPPGRDREMAMSPLSMEKFRGYREALASTGVAIDRAPVIVAQPGDPAVGPTLFERAPEATAALVMTDRQAVTVLEEAKRRGIVVPRDLSVMGFDGVGAGTHSDPPLTTIAHAIAEKGRLAASMVLGLEPPRAVLLPVKLVGRSSTAGPRKPKR